MKKLLTLLLFIVTYSGYSQVYYNRTVHVHKDTTVNLTVHKDTTIRIRCPQITIGSNVINVCNDTTIVCSNSDSVITIHDSIPYFFDSRPVMEITVFWGQSNASGTTTGTVSIPGYLSAPLAKCLIYNPTNDSLEILTYPTNNFGNTAGKHGIELAYMYARQQLIGDSICMVKLGVAGTRIQIFPAFAHQDWNVNSKNELYWSLRKYTKAAMKNVELLGYRPVLNMIVWQGESDSDTLAVANAYYQNTLNFFNRFKADLKCPDIHIIIVRIHNISTYPYDTVVRAYQDSLGALTNIITHSVDDLEPTQLHMNSTSYHTIGARLAPLFPY